MQDIYYIIYRVYSKKERMNNIGVYDRIYGWTINKEIVKGLMHQRDKNKYKIYKCDMSDDKHQDHNLTENNMINILKLKSSSTYEDFYLFITMNEMCECEKRIQRLFYEAASVENIDEDRILYFLNLILNITPYYSSALEYLGYRPPEADMVFTSDLCELESDDIDHRIEMSYESQYFYDIDSPCIDELPGLSNLDNISNRIIYSIESFIKVLKDDM